jgi:hypothetical protein
VGEPLFDPDAVPPLYYADVATKLAFVFLIESPLLSPLRANVPAGPWVELHSYVPYVWFRGNPPLGALAGIGLIALCVFWLARFRTWVGRAEARARLATLGRILCVYLLLIAAGYTFYSPAHWYFNRYLTGAVLLTTVHGVAWGGLLLRAGRSRRPTRVAVALCGLGIIACLSSQWRFFSRLPGSDAPAGGFLGAWQELAPRMDGSARVGAFQAGVYGYFGGRQVINLDGKANQDAFEALRDKRLHEYLRAQRIRYVLDWDWVFVSLCTRYAAPGSLRVRSIAVDARGSGVQLFEVAEGGR